MGQVEYSQDILYKEVIASMKVYAEKKSMSFEDLREKVYSAMPMVEQCQFKDSDNAAYAYWPTYCKLCGIHKTEEEVRAILGEDVEIDEGKCPECGGIVLIKRGAGLSGLYCVDCGFDYYEYDD